MKLKYLFPLFAMLFFFSCAEDPLPEEEEMEMEEEMEEVIEICDTDRYTSPIFTEVDSVMNVKFAESNPLTAHPNDLFMDIYMPAEGTDTLTNRPVIIWAFGGAFIGGSRDQMHFLARQSAKFGYVSASMDYRLLSVFPLPDSTIVMNTAVKASSDMKAAIRHFVMSADQGNEFNIDPDQIYVGGISSGAITALMTGIVTDEDIDNDFLRSLIDNNGGIAGNTGSEENRSYDYSVKGIVNLSGAVYKLDFLDATDPPIFSVHGDDDEVVPYVFGMPNVLIPIEFNLYGSKSIFDKCEEVGLRNDLVTINGGGHVDIYSEDEYAQIREDFFDLGYQFLKDEICN